MPRFPFRGRQRAPKPRPAVELGPTLFDRAVAPTARASATPASRAAADLAYLRSYKVAEAALRLLAVVRPMTSNECAELLGEDDQTVRPRFSQMKARGWLEALKERRPTGHGGKAHVHRITDAGRAVLVLLTAKQRENAA